MERDTSNRFGAFRAAVVFAYCGLLAACSGLPGGRAPVSVSSVYEITGKPAADTSGPVVAEIRPGSAQGELRLVVVPPGQAVQGMVPAHQIRRAATAPDRHAKELRPAR
jgi:hypothetical protein